MVYATEPTVNVGLFDSDVLDDQWSVMTDDDQLSMHFEHTIAVTDDGPEVFTVAVAMTQLSRILRAIGNVGTALLKVSRVTYLRCTAAQVRSRTGF